MPAPNAIPADKLARLIGTPRCRRPMLDVRRDADYRADPRMCPGAVDRCRMRLLADGRAAFRAPAGRP
jgi:hypothetical protein